MMEKQQQKGTSARTVVGLPGSGFVQFLVASAVAERRCTIGAPAWSRTSLPSTRRLSDSFQATSWID